MHRTRTAPGLVLMPALALVVSAVAAAQTEQDRLAGQAAFERAVGLYDGGDRAGALEQFRESYQLHPSAVAVFNIGVCLQESGDLQGALDVFRGFLEEYEAAASPEDLADVRARVAELQNARAAESPPGGESSAQAVAPVPAVEAVPVVSSPAETALPVSPAREAAPVATPVPGGPGDEIRLELEPRPTSSLASVEPQEEAALARETDGVAPTWFWASLLTTVAAGVAGGATSAMVLVTENEFEDARQAWEEGDESAVVDGRRLADSYDDYRLATNVLLPVAGALALTTFILGLLADFDGEPERAPATQVLVSPTSAVSVGAPTGLALGLTVSF